MRRYDKSRPEYSGRLLSLVREYRRNNAISSATPSEAPFWITRTERSTGTFTSLGSMRYIGTCGRT